MIFDIVEGELCIDIDGLSIFTKAKYKITSFWDDGKLTGATAVLIEWMFEGAWTPRSFLSVIVGEGRVERAEEAFAERWTETAEADARDANADLYRLDNDE